MRLVRLGHLVLAFLAIAASAGANTLSKIYDQAFANPNQFQGYLLLQVDENDYARFAECARRADPILLNLEENLRDQHKNCDENPECTAAAKQIQVVIEARDNVRALAAYMKQMSGTNAPAFEDTEAGERAIGPFEAMKSVLGMSDQQATAWMRQIPVYIGVIAALESVPCQ